VDCIDYKKLYRLQDKVLAAVFAVESEFYLTGGTCISRFYQEKRYSDDLDFFTNCSPRYNFAVKKIKLTLQKIFQVDIEIETKNFTRFKIDKLLQVDFINDITSRYKDAIMTESGYLIDNIENILSNKLTAVMGRDNPKDIFDIYLIWKYYDFLWLDILESAHEKTGFNDSELIVRLKSFPIEFLEHIHVIDNTFLDDFENQFKELINSILKVIGLINT